MYAFDRALHERDTLAFDRDSARRFDVDGRMHVERCNISKANVCPYYGREIPGSVALGLEPNRIYMLYRAPDELARAAASFNNLQLLQQHAPVNAADHRAGATVGTVSDVRFDAPYLTGAVTVWAADAISRIESKAQKQLSCSYRYRADMTPGYAPDGVAYDGVMRDITGNHVALVREGRAGPDVYVSDSRPSPELPTMKNSALVTALVAALAASGVVVSDDAKIALDTALEAAKMDDDAEEERKRKEREAAAGVGAGTPDVAAVDAAIDARGLVTKEEAAKIAADAVAGERALHQARKDVEPLVGVVAMDSAEAVYRFALDKAGVAVDGVDSSAFGALVNQVKQRKAAPPAAPVRPVNDASSVLGLGRIARG